MMRFHAALTLCALVAIGASAQPASTPLTMDPSIRVGTLPNGITYYIQVNKKPEKRMELRLAVNAGSVLESDDQQGIAHLCEHMAFNGTQHFPKQDLVNTLELMGVNFGADLNAYTSFDETVYMLEVPTDTLALMEKGMQVMEDWAHLASYDSDEVDKERGVVIEEWRLGRGSWQRLEDKELPVVLNGSHYAQRLPIGKKEILETTPVDRVRAFYRDWYRPDLEAIVAVGDFDPDQVEAMIKQHFSSIPARTGEKPRASFPVPEQEKPLAVVATDKEATESSVSVIYKLPVDHTRTLEDFRRDMTDRLIGAMISERLRELTEQADPPFVSAYAYKGREVRTADSYTVEATVKDNGAQRGLEALATEIARVNQHGFTATELDRAKINMLRGQEKAYTERDKQESRGLAGACVYSYLYGNPTLGAAQTYTLGKEVIPAITMNEIEARLKALVTGRDLVITADMPEKESIAPPANDDLLKTFAAVSARPVTAYVDKVTTAPLVSASPAAGTIVDTKTIASLGVTEWTLSNGVRVVLKPTDFKNDEILFSAYAPGGWSVADLTDRVPAQSADDVMGACGVGAFDPAALRKVLTGKVASASVSIADYFNYVRGNASPKDLATLFQLIYLRMTAPRVDSVQYAALLARMRTQLANKSAEPQSVWSDTIEVTMAQHNPWAEPNTLATIDKYDLGKSYSFYRECFGDARGFTFFFVGNFTLDGIKPLVLTYLGGLPCTQREPHWRDLHIEPPTGVVTREVDKGEEPKSMVLTRFTGPFTWMPKERHDLQATCEAITIRLREVLREDKSGVYFVFLSPGWHHVPKDEYAITMMYGCAPNRVDELQQAAYQIIDSIREHGIAQKYVDKVREEELRQRQVSLKQNNFWVGVLQSYIQNGEDPEELLKYNDWANALTPQALQGMAQKYLTRTNSACFVLKPQR